METQDRIELGARLKREMNCCQAVVRVYADRLGDNAEVLLKTSSGFGSGMGTMDGTCGALVGAGMVASNLAPDGVAMKLSRQILPRFRELCGATICRELKGVGTGKVLCGCEDCVRNAIRAMEESLASIGDVPAKVIKTI